MQLGEGASVATFDVLTMPAPATLEATLWKSFSLSILKSSARSAPLKGTSESAGDEYWRLQGGGVMLPALVGELFLQN
jgi:hypothetical protein